MNPYSLAILIALFIRFILFMTATFLNIINIIQSKYEDIKQNYSYAEYSKACLYTKAKSKAALIRNFLSTALLMLFWLLSCFSYLDIFVRNISNSDVLNGTLFISILMAMVLSVRTVYSGYLTFVTEQKFGFNSATLKVWIHDQIKSIAIYYAIALPIIVFVLTLFSIYGANTWWIAWIIISIASIIVEMIVPKLSLRLFYETKSITNPQLKAKILAYCETINYPVNDIYIVDGSKRTTKVNAYFIGFGKTKAIVLFDTILDNFTDDEILSIIGHEAGHFKLKHNIYNSIFGIAFAGSVLFLFHIFIADFRLFSAFFVYKFSYYAGITFFTILYSVADIIVSPIMKYYLRKIEEQADIFSAQTTENKAAMISALKKLSIKNLINPLPHAVYVMLYRSSYSIEQRIATIEKLKS